MNTRNAIHGVIIIFTNHCMLVLVTQLFHSTSSIQHFVYVVVYTLSQNPLLAVNYRDMYIKEHDMCTGYGAIPVNSCTPHEGVGRRVPLKMRDMCINQFDLSRQIIKTLTVDQINFLISWT